jgi:prepilin signal peptidase PulO-like enzyme (type II secretory pathway)
MVSVLALLGLILGSFAGASVWRLRARQLVEDKAEGEEYDKKELKRLVPLTKTSFKTDRSRCLHCNVSLQWYDLLPLVSWISMGGKCRYCKKSIGVFEPIIEVGTAALLVSFYLYWVQVAMLDVGLLFIVWIIALVLLVILFAYDAKWFLLPDVIMFPFIGLSLIISFQAILVSENGLQSVASTAGSVAIFSGLYLVLWLVSRGAWIGFGDVKLGLGLGLLLGDWKLAFLALFLSNLIGLGAVLPGLLSKKLSSKAHIPFGPFMILGFLVTLYFGVSIYNWYEVSLPYLITLML